MAWLGFRSGVSVGRRRRRASECAPGGDGITADAHLVIRCDAGNPAETEGHCGSEGSWPIRVENHTELQLAGLGVRLLRPVRKGKPERAGSALFKPLRQLIESVNQTLPG